MSQDHTTLVDAQGNNDLELGSIRRVTSFHFPQETDSTYNSARSSLDESYYQNHHCDVHIHDDIAINSEALPAGPDHETPGPYSCHRAPSLLESTGRFPPTGNPAPTRTGNLPEQLKKRLQVSAYPMLKSSCADLVETRDPLKSRWM